MKRERMWELKQSATENTLELYIYGEVEDYEYYDWWKDEVVRSETSANYFKNELEKYPNVTQINLYINSQGGSVLEGTAIYNQLKRHTANKTVYIDGFACSIASIIAMAGDEIVMPKNTLMMIHNLWTYAMGNAAELRKAADDLDVINAAGRQAYLEKAGNKLKEDELIAMMDKETWLTADDCIKYGLADRYAEQEVDMTKAKELLQKANLDLQQRIEIQKSLVAQLRKLTMSIPAQKEKKPKNEPQNMMQMLCGFFDTEKGGN